VTRVDLLHPELIRAQLEAVLTDIPPGAAKTGALGGIDQVELLAAMAVAFTFPLVIDPVMVSKHGAPLLSAEAQAAIRRKLLPVCTLITPNIAEAEVLTGDVIDDLEGAEKAARKLADMGAPAVLVKGGHLPGESVDILYTDGVVEHMRGTRLHTRHTHGTGCTYSAAITALLARGFPLADAVRRAKAFIQRAIETAPGLGAGAGPVNHFADAGDLTAASS
jgi:hydroxymethylpyrimidine/phosphomethylpyrimidine kinase